MDINVNTSNLDNADRKAVRFIVDAENARRAALDPPETPLLTGSASEYKASYEEILKETLERAHASYIDQAGDKELTARDVRTLWRGATDAQRDAAVAALTT